MENLYIKMLEFVQLKSQANEFNYDIPDSVNCIKNRLDLNKFQEKLITKIKSNNYFLYN